MIFFWTKLSLDEAYALIIDGSITVGGQQLMLQLKAPSEHLGQPLTHVDTEVVSMKVADSWSSEKVSKNFWPL